MSVSNDVSNHGPRQSLDSKQWDAAIKDAEGELQALARKRMRLQQAIRIFRANKRDGVRWPGDRIIGQDG